MENKKEYCENLYNKYKELMEKTKLEAHNIKPGGKINAKYIDIKDIKEKIKVKEELHGCLDYGRYFIKKDLSLQSEFIPDSLKIIFMQERESSHMPQFCGYNPPLPVYIKQNPGQLVF